MCRPSGTTVRELMSIYSVCTLEIKKCTYVPEGVQFILCYIMRYGMINYQNSLDILRTKCQDVFKPNINYEKTIKKFMEDLFNK